MKFISKSENLYIDYHYDNKYHIVIMTPKKYFTNPFAMLHRQYEALRAHYVEGKPFSVISKQYGLSESYLRKLRVSFEKKCKNSENPFFSEIKKGPKRSHKADCIRSLVVDLRKQNFSIIDIKSRLEGTQKNVSLDTINRILKEEGFTRLPRRTFNEKRDLSYSNKMESPRASQLTLQNEEFSTGTSGGILIFLPLLEKLGIISAIEKANFPETQDISAVSYVLSFLALKLIGNKRLSHDDNWALNRVLGLFAGLNVLPKSSSLSSYSYRISRKANRSLLLALSQIFQEGDEGEFNIDFKTIPHWGDASILEKNYVPTRKNSMKSVLSLIVQSVSQNSQPYISYTNAELKKSDQHNAILEFVDFWKEGHDTSPKMLIFDSKVTVHENLSKLNEDGIKFITLRQRGQKMQKHAASIPEDKWEYIWVEAAKKKTRDVKVYDEVVSFPKYKGKIRQLIIIDHSKEPIFMITNDFETKACDLIRKYGRRWLVEQEISEQIVFFHLNSLSSSIVVKVDFDLTLTVLAHNLYRKMALDLDGFQHCNVETLHRKFIDGRADVRIIDNTLTTTLNRRSHLPILFELPWLQEETDIPRLGCKMKFKIGTSS